MQASAAVGLAISDVTAAVMWTSHHAPMVAQILVAGGRPSAPGSVAVLVQRLAMLAGALKAEPPGLAGSERRA